MAAFAKSWRRVAGGGSPALRSCDLLVPTSLLLHRDKGISPAIREVMGPKTVKAAH
jgi:hypothetical protein